MARGIWVVVKIIFVVWVLDIIRHLVFRGPKKDNNFDNHPYIAMLIYACV